MYDQDVHAYGPGVSALWPNYKGDAQEGAGAASDDGRWYIYT